MISASTGYGRGQRRIEIASIALFVLLAGWSLWRLALESGAWFPLLVLLAAPCGWIAADLLSGLLHFAFDTWGSVKTPLIGPAFIRPFREHHADPQEMTRHDFIETHGASCLAALPVLMVAAFISPDSILKVFVQAFLVFVALGGLATNQCHKWAHMEAAATPRLVRLAQRWRLALPREHHQMHHTPPFNTHFCISCGWLNPLFDRVVQAWRS